MDIFELKTIIIVLAILAGTFLIYLGYRLYVLGIKELGDAEVSVSPVSVKLTRFGPGVVLALFGAGLIVFGITRNFTASSTTKVTQALPSGGNMAVESSANLNAAYIETSNEISLAADANVLAGQNDAINNDSGDQAANEKR